MNLGFNLTSDSTSSSMLNLSSFCFSRDAKPLLSTSDWSKTPLRLILRERSLFVKGKKKSSSSSSPLDQQELLVVSSSELHDVQDFRRASPSSSSCWMTARYMPVRYIEIHWDIKTARYMPVLPNCFQILLCTTKSAMWVFCPLILLLHSCSPAISSPSTSSFTGGSGWITWIPIWSLALTGGSIWFDHLVVFLLPPFLLLPPPFGRCDPICRNLSLLLVASDALEDNNNFTTNTNNNNGNNKSSNTFRCFSLLPMLWRTADRCRRLSSNSSKYSKSDTLDLEDEGLEDWSLLDNGLEVSVWCPTMLFSPKPASGTQRVEAAPKVTDFGGFCEPALVFAITPPETICLLFGRPSIISLLEAFSSFAPTLDHWLWWPLIVRHDFLLKPDFLNCPLLPTRVDQSALRKLSHPKTLSSPWPNSFISSPSLSPGPWPNLAGPLPGTCHHNHYRHNHHHSPFSSPGSWSNLAGSTA